MRLAEPFSCMSTFTCRNLIWRKINRSIEHHGFFKPPLPTLHKHSSGIVSMASKLHKHNEVREAFLDGSTWASEFENERLSAMDWPEGSLVVSRRLRIINSYGQSRENPLFLQY
jgi:hypothetical protein